MGIREQTIIYKSFVDFVGDIFSDYSIEEISVLESYKSIKFMATFLIIDLFLFLLGIVGPV